MSALVFQDSRVVISKKIAPTKNTSCTGSAGMTERRNWAARFINKLLAGQRIMPWLVNEKLPQTQGYFIPMNLFKLKFGKGSWAEFLDPILHGAK